MDKQVYQAQDRGTETDYQQYLSAMDSISVEKVASASVFYDPSPGNTIVDVGMASGTSSNILAHLFPESIIIGVDINPTMVEFAACNYHLPNLSFRIDDGEKLETFGDAPINGFFNCSSIHHITSFNNYNPYRAYNTLKRQSDLLQTGGIIIVRDFVKTPEIEVILELNAVEENGLPSDADLLCDFALKARSLSNPQERGFPIKELPTSPPGTRRFSLFYSDATEFIRRKDYYQNWEIELQEEYGYFTQAQFEDVFRSLGLRIIVSNPIYNPWIINNRYRGKFTVYSKSGKDLGFPPTNYLIAGEKVKRKGTRVYCVRHLPENRNPFLRFSTWQNVETEKNFDLVKRPHDVTDIIPYCINGTSIEITAKHGYPRPIISVQSDSPILDQKHFSGYITEGITDSTGESIESALGKYAGIEKNKIIKTVSSLEYFTSPGGIDERVKSVFVELTEISNDEYHADKHYSKFISTGSIRRFDAYQLLKTSQTGALVEARLELNLYNLLRKHNLPFPRWLGEKLVISELPVKAVSLSDVLNIKGSDFKTVENSINFLEKRRAKFCEEGVPDSNEILEYVIPAHYSINTVVTIPVIRNGKEYYVGLEQRNLPVPALYTGNSSLLVAPASRLPKEVSCFKQLEDFIMQLDFFETKIIGFSKLGEKFFPSAGISPEQVYPYVVSVKDASDTLKWVNLQDLYDNLEDIRDGHLLISILRLFNALHFTN